MSTPEGKSYKDTLFLPKTDFPMKGNLTVREPARLEKWNSEGLYSRIIAKRKAEGAPRFILHDGPPFANGDVHMGTGLNKVLKDFVVKSKTMAGFETPYIPGWDCHGLPIEFKVMQGDDARDVEPAEIRRRCETFARGWIDTQRDSFKRLGVFGDWDNPYLTLNPAYEANIIRTFASLIEKGCIYQSKKPVQWSYGAKTALAEAEVEYQDKKSTAVFVNFDLADAPDSVPGGTSIAIWTTTPWTLPANLG
ncbi:MAG: class I tRNA ligase family protein, partial [Akkermansiaceae bacterium]|nr:class I tRNA ligase family protein [Akkermansiaceae bacterium]